MNDRGVCSILDDATGCAFMSPRDAEMRSRTVFRGGETEEASSARLFLCRSTRRQLIDWYILI